MKPTLLCLSLALALATPLAQAADAPKFKPFGVDLSARDTSVKPGDDFNRYANGKWLDSYQLKDDQTRYGSFNELSDEAEVQVRAIIEELAKRRYFAPGSEEQKVADYYASYMNLAAPQRRRHHAAEAGAGEDRRDRFAGRADRRVRHRRH